jgi:hypothetical protein
MTLRPDQKAALEELGTQLVRLQLENYPRTGMGAEIGGFKCGGIARQDIVTWLTAKIREEEAQQARLLASTLHWAKIAGWAGVIGAILALVFGVAALLHLE